MKSAFGALAVMPPAGRLPDGRGPGNIRWAPGRRACSARAMPARRSPRTASRASTSRSSSPCSAPPSSIARTGPARVLRYKSDACTLFVSMYQRDGQPFRAEFADAYDTQLRPLAARPVRRFHRRAEKTRGLKPRSDVSSSVVNQNKGVARLIGNFCPSNLWYEGVVVHDRRKKSQEGGMDSARTELKGNVEKLRGARRGSGGRAGVVGARRRRSEDLRAGSAGAAASDEARCRQAGRALE